jgi:hypothetical protein
MDLTPHVEALRQQLLVAAEPGGETARELAGRLVAALDPAARMVLLEVLSTATDEITSEIAPGSVEVRLRGGDPEFVVNLPEPDLSPSNGETAAPTSTSTAPVPAPAAAIVDTDEGSTSRITLRLPEALKVRIEERAGADGVSVNSWLVRAVADAVDHAGSPAPPPRRTPSGGQRVTGWAR